MASTTGLPYVGRRIVCAVAQKPWTDLNDHTFCTLAPLLLDDGKPVHGYEFPANGLVWWMIAPEDKVAAEPGRLVGVKVEASREAGTPGKDFYQVARHSVAEVTEHGFTELIELPDSATKELTGLLTRRFALNHRPARLVYAVWQQHLYGPLLTKVTEDGLYGQVWIQFDLPAQNAGESVIQRFDAQQNRPGFAQLESSTTWKEEESSFFQVVGC